MLRLKLSQDHLYFGARRPIVKSVLFLLTLSFTIFPAQGALSPQTPNIDLKQTISNQEIDLLQTGPVAQNIQESHFPQILTTCISHKNGTHYISKRTECNKRIYETRHWFIQGSAPEGTPGSVLVAINVCASKKRLNLVIRNTCNRSTQDSITYQRRVGQPDPPKITKVVMGTLSRASISITPPSDDGGAVITHYTVYAFPGDHKSTVLASELKSAQITTLTPGTRYRFAVNATNNLGTSALSEQSEPILAPNVPDPPKITKVVMGTLSRASISITPPSDDGGAVITHYTIYAFPGDHKSTVLASEIKSAQITSLTPGTRYRFAVNATNNLGTSALSEQSEPILAPNVPDPPKITSLFFYGGRDAEVFFVESEFDGGAPILGYSVFATVVGSNHYGNQGSFFVSSLQTNTGSIMAVELPHTTTLTLSLVAFNLAGNSLPSEPWPSITTECVVDREANLRITEGLISGVGVPSTAGTKSSIVTAANGYSGTISWSFSQLPGTKSSLGSSFFGAMRTYTATIELVPDCPKGKIRVPANFFTVSGATSVSNAENSGVITAVFPATGPGVPNKALILTQPSGGVRGEILATQPVVRVTDIDDNTNTTYTGSVVASAGQLSGATVSAVSGIATYTSLAFTTSPSAGGTYEITFTPTGLISAISNSISILSAPSLSVETSTVGTTRRSLFTRAATILYSSTNFSGSDTVTATFAPSGGGCASTVAGTVLEGASEPVINGRATFSNLKIDGKIGDCYRLIFTSNRFNQSTGNTDNEIKPLQGTVCNGSFTCQVGDTGPAGGKIFYAVSTPFACGPSRTSSCKYLEAAPSGWNTGSDPARTWSQITPVNYQTTSVNNPTSPETATATAIGWGYWNTRAIVGQGNTDSSTAAAALADSYTVTVSGTTYADWFLPSQDELTALMENVSEGLSGDYWSSSETIGACQNGPNPLTGSCATMVNTRAQLGAKKTEE